MSNFQDETVDQQKTEQNQSQNQNQQSNTGIDDPGWPQDAAQPLDAEERQELEEETEDMIHQQPGSHEGQAGQDELEDSRGQRDLEGSQANDYGADASGGERDDNLSNTGGVPGFEAGPDDNNQGNNISTQSRTDADTGYGISESGAGGGVDGIGQSGAGERAPSANPTAGGASAGANTAGIGQGTTDFDEDDAANKEG